PGPAAGEGPRGLARVPVPVTETQWTRLGDLATVKVQPGETEIARDDQRTMVPVTARLSHRDLGSAMNEIRRRIARQVALPKDMQIEYAGLWVQQQSSF